MFFVVFFKILFIYLFIFFFLILFLFFAQGVHTGLWIIRLTSFTAFTEAQTLPNVHNPSTLSLPSHTPVTLSLFCEIRSLLWFVLIMF